MLRTAPGWQQHCHVPTDPLLPASFLSKPPRRQKSPNVVKNTNKNSKERFQHIPCAHSQEPRSCWRERARCWTQTSMAKASIIPHSMGFKLDYLEESSFPFSGNFNRLIESATRVFWSLLAHRQHLSKELGDTVLETNVFTSSQ